MLAFLYVALGGAAGSVARYALVLLVRPHSPGFPAGTLTVNLIGCALIGLLGGFFHQTLASRDSGPWLVLAIGVLGGFTTFSSFGLESVELIRAGRPVAAASYVLLSNMLGILLALGGYSLLAGRGG